MARYLWFHAFNRPTAETLLDVLRQGASVAPGSTTTKENEKRLGIKPSCVYAYLGKTLEAFGTNAFAVPMDSPAGTVSPFDTGGLIKHIPPVASWDDSRKREFVKRLSWASAELPDLLKVYPGSQDVETAAYLRGQRPVADGPANLWFPEDAVKEGHIWKLGDVDGRAWLWEIQSTTRLRAGKRLHAWSCASATYDQILRYQEALNDDEDIQWLEELHERFIDGGVGALVRELRRYQEAA